MQESLYIASSAGMKQQRKLEVLSNNLANVSSPGFKKDRLLFHELLPPFTPENNFETAKNALLEPSLSNRSTSYVGVTGMSTDFSQGPMTATGNPLDIALEGDGYFTVQTPDGLRYTRKGNFRLDENNRLITASGFPVMTPTNQAINIPPTGGTITIDPSGTVNFGDGVQSNPVAQLKLVTFAENAPLEKEGNGFFRKQPNQEEIKATTVQVRQGFVENSNVNMVEEMTQMITTHRTFEAIQRLIQSIDSVNEQSVNSIGRVA